MRSARFVLSLRRAVPAVSHLAARSHALARHVPRQRVNPLAGHIARRFASSGDLVDVNTPAMGDSITEATIADMGAKVGDSVAEDDLLLVLETDKVGVDVRAPTSGVIKEVLVEEGDTVNVGDPLFRVEAGDAPAPSESSSSSSSSSAPAPAPASSPAPAPSPSPAPAPSPSPAPSPAPADEGEARQASADRTEKRTKMNRMRTRISQRLKDSQNTYAMLTTFQEVDMSSVIAMRKRHKEAFEKTHGVRLGFMSAFVKASAAALREVPAVNNVIDGGEIVERNFVDVSVAVATPKGLVVPVVRDADGLTFAGVEKEINSLATKARDGKLSLEDMAGGTFTISNGGVYGSLFGTPIINPPQSAILGMHATKMRPVAVGDKVEVRPIMYLALTYDHRLIDGREAVTFLCSVRDKIEDPTRLLLEM